MGRRGVFLKRIYIAVLSFVLLLVLTICDREEVSSTAMPEITIHMDGKVIQSQTLSREVGIELDDESALEPGATIRGFHLTGKWADQTKDILFVVRTDAK
jgi:hypothetical protein